MKLIDIGCNLSSPRLLPQLDRILSDAHKAGVYRQVLTGTDPESNMSSLELAHNHKSLYCTAGHHPHHADDWNSQKHSMILRMMAQDSKVVAVGEMGLDYWRNFSSHSMQKRCFQDQLEVAIEVGKPVFLHERQAFDDFMTILKPALPHLKGAVWHCFTGTQAQMLEAIDLGMYIGITGWVCDPVRGKALQETVRHIPADRLMIETDAPYLTPKTLQPTPRTNEPKYLPEVLRILAKCRGDDPEVLTKQTTDNAVRFFGIE